MLAVDDLDLLSLLPTPAFEVKGEAVGVELRGEPLRWSPGGSIQSKSGPVVQAWVYLNAPLSRLVMAGVGVSDGARRPHRERVSTETVIGTGPSHGNSEHVSLLENGLVRPMFDLNIVEPRVVVGVLGFPLTAGAI